MSRDNGTFDLPIDMRAFAERSMEQAKTAFDSFVTAAQQAATRCTDPGHECAEQCARGRHAGHAVRRAQHRLVI